MNENTLYRKIARWVLASIILLFILINAIIAIQAYAFTHFEENTQTLTSNAQKSLGKKLDMLFTGIDIPRSHTKKYPTQEYDSISIPAGENKRLDAWIMQTQGKSKGLVILFHGYMDEKSQMLDYSYLIMDMGYSVMLVDFMGSGKSYGNQSTIGHKEAENVKTSFEYAKNQMKEKRVYLLGFSMGAAAIIKAQHDYGLQVSGLIAEASYGRMFGTIETRARQMGFGVLSKPVTYSFSFWMNLTNGINSFDMNPEEYARGIRVPTLIACGGKDQFIPQSETQGIFDNLPEGNKELKFYPECMHELYHQKYPEEWKETIRQFLDSAK